MRELNLFYSTYSDEIGRHPFDLKYLGRDRWLVFDPARFRPDSTHFVTPTTADDYDRAFISALARVYPLGEVEDFLNHHYNFYVAGQESRRLLFLRHIQQNILPGLQRRRAHEHAEQVERWLKAQRNTPLQDSLAEKIFWAGYMG